ncbi:MAG: FAD-dependent oxidoreductase, partial [Candidatus Woesearchaeota archaeon]|nr:FAD-dependent oxidoreductase [Candidatus Woesearchaeota archaeon]
SKAKDSAGADPLILRNEVVGIKRSGDVYRLTVQERDGNKYNFDSRIVINCGGLHSDKNAINAGIDIDRSGYRLFFCKGEYFRVSSKHTGRINHLIYPVPAHAGLGVHVTLELDGSMKLGPNTIWLPGNVFDYSVDDSHRKEFFEAAKEYLPFLDIEDLQPDQAGIRPKLFGPGMAKRDFVISEESSKGLPGLINLIGIESPGLTASPAIGKYVREIVDEIL